MDPAPARRSPARPGLPRTRGDGPLVRTFPARPLAASPHTRGWTREPRPAPRHQAGFPAHAGMDPAGLGALPAGPGLPRTRGDGPLCVDEAVPVPAASPHTRGWTRRVDDVTVLRGGFPAHAGMDRWARCRAAARRWLPRTRGDGPAGELEPRDVDVASPHTRGWTQARIPFVRLVGGFPAHAGMDPGSWIARRTCSGLPRTRGDGPPLRPRSPIWYAASPHTPGWTRSPPPAG